MHQHDQRHTGHASGPSDIGGDWRPGLFHRSPRQGLLPYSEHDDPTAPHPAPLWEIDLNIASVAIVA
jgi:hypothetical protein